MPSRWTGPVGSWPSQWAGLAGLAIRWRLHWYVALGLVATGIHVVVASLAIKAGASVVPANVAGFSVAFAFSYLTQSRRVFGASPTARNLLRYLSVQAGALGISLYASGVLGDPFARTLLTALILPAVAYVLHRTWTFAAPRSRRARVEG